MGHDEHPNPNPMDDPSAPPLVLGAILGVVLTLVTIVGTAALYFRSEQRLERQAGDNAAAPLANRIQAEQRTQLASGVDWIDKSKGVVGVPIDMAMQMVVKEHGGSK